MRALAIITGLLLLASLSGYAQNPLAEKLVPIDTPSRDKAAGVIAFPVRGKCKGIVVARFVLMQEALQARAIVRKKDKPRKPPLVTVHGNILYDFDYWNYLDTPYAESNINQQTLQSYVDLNYRNEYPFRVIFTTRWSNSPLFRNMTDVSFQYNAAQFHNQVKRQALGLLLKEYAEKDSLARLEKTLHLQENEFHGLNNWLNGPEQQQRLMAQQELAWLKSRDTLGTLRGTADPLKIPGWDPRLDYGSARHGAGTSGDSGKSKLPSVDSSWLKRYDSLQRRLDTLGTRLDSLERQYRRLSASRGKSTSDLQQELEGITSGKVLKEKLDSEHIADSSLPKGYKTMYSVRSLGIGRRVLNYSELSAKNVSIDGIQLEYTPSNYMAFAAGTVDYRFRDYSLNDAVKGQWLGVVRYGWGKKEGNNVILTYYTGRRQLYNASTTLQSTDIPNYNLMGFTVQGTYKLFRSTYLIGEAAKSSLPYYSLDSTQSHNMLASAFRLNDRSNEAYSLKINSFLPATQTKLSAIYSRYGANFQSFSLFTTGTQQSAWSIRVDQPFLQKQLMVTGSVRTNDFINPLLSTAYSSTAVFASIQATLRMKKWPVVSVGYYPSSQIVKLADGQYQENLFYTMTATASETYKAKNVTLLSMAMFTRFYNKITDTGFIYFNTTNLQVSQMVMAGRWTLQLQGSIAVNSSYDLYVGDLRADYRVFSWLTVGAGAKYNDQTVYDIRQWGYSANAALNVRKIGTFRLMGDKGFIPGSGRELVPNNLGRLTYSKIF